MKSKEQLLQTVLKALEPVKKISCAEWAEQNFQLPATSAEPGKYRLSRTPYAKEILEAFTQPKIKKVVVMSSSQVGKALDIETPIPTPNGWALMRDLKAGDKIFDERGNICQVTFATDIMYNHKCYKIIFSDGAEIIADAEHNWFVQDTKTNYNEKNKILTTEEISKDYKIEWQKMRNRYAIPVAKTLNLSEKDLPIEPYLLGVWLGDGHSNTISITIHDADIEIAERLKKFNYSINVHHIDKRNPHTLKIDLTNNKDKNFCLHGHDMRIVGKTKRGYCAACSRQYQHKYKKGIALDSVSEVPLRTKFRQLNLINNKHIPQMYLRASYNQRMELLRGLMDTDGSITVKGNCEFTQKNKILAENVFELLVSLGFKPTFRSRIAKCTYKGKIKSSIVYRIHFVAYSDNPVFHLARKKMRLKNKDTGRITETFRRRIISVEQVESRPVKCIAVNSPNHLYLAGREMIPTHNTSILLIVLARFIHVDPCNILFVLPTLELAQDMSKDRIESMIRDNKVLTNLFYSDDKKKTRDKNQTMLSKFFKGGRLVMVGANSPTGLSSRPIRLLLCDEVDRFSNSAGKEGDPIELAETRQSTYWNRITGLFSTPTIEGISRIEKEFLAGTQEVWSYECPNCKEYHTIEYINIDSELKFTCPDCGFKFTEQEMKRAKQKYIVKNPSAEGVRSFWLNAFSSPWLSWSEIMKKWREARGTPDLEQTVFNTKFGRTYKLIGEYDNTDIFLKRREIYPAEIPPNVLILTAAVDVQANRLEYEIAGWNRDERWGILRGVILGSPTDALSWMQLDEVLDRIYYKANGEGLKVIRTFIDSGYSTRLVYAYCKANIYKGRYAIKGIGAPGKPLIINYSYPKNTGITLTLLGVNDGKSEVFSRLQIEPGEKNYWHYPENDEYFVRGYDEKYFEQLISEKKVIKKQNGVQYIAWETVNKKARNESLDLAVYNCACVQSLQINWDMFEKPEVRKKVRKHRKSNSTVDIY